MAISRTYLLLLLAAFAAAALPVWGLGAAPGLTSRAAQSVSPPDFSGLWHRWLRPGLGPPESGPGPVTNRSRVNGASNYNQLVGDFTNPILNAQAAEVVKKHGELSLSGVGYPTPSNQCWPGGVPYVFWNFGMRMLQQKDRITIVYLHDHEVRHVRLNDSHPANVTPSWYGDSVAHYEGDTLVIDTVGLKIGPHSMVDMYGTPHSKALRVVERYRLLDYDEARVAFGREAKINARYPRGLNAIDFDPDYKGKHLQLEITIEDEGVFTTPWSAVMTYGRPLGQWLEHVCAEAASERRNSRESAVPTADKPDF
jgi:hypothetical protein